MADSQLSTTVLTPALMVQIECHAEEFSTIRILQVRGFWNEVHLTYQGGHLPFVCLGMGGWREQEHQRTHDRTERGFG